MNNFHLSFVFLDTKFILNISLKKQLWNFFNNSYTKSIIKKKILTV